MKQDPKQRAGEAITALLDDLGLVLPPEGIVFKVDAIKVATSALLVSASLMRTVPRPLDAVQDAETAFTEIAREAWQSIVAETEEPPQPPVLNSPFPPSLSMANASRRPARRRPRGRS